MQRDWLAPKLHHYTPLVTDEASPVTVPQPTPPGVWRKTAEHKPPVGVHKHLRGNDGTVSTQARYFDGTTWCASANPSDATPSCRQTWQWLDTSGEFKVGDRVRVIADGGGAVKPGATGVIVAAYGGQCLRIDGLAGLWAWGADWLEHA